MAIHYKPGEFCFFFAKKLEGKSPYVQTLFSWLVKYADNDNGTSFPSLKTLSDKTRIKKTKLLQTLKELVDLGWLEITHRKNENQWENNLYRLTMYSNEEIVEINENIKASSPCDEQGVVRVTNKGSPCDEQGVVRHTVTNYNHNNYNQLTNNNICPIAPKNDYPEEFNTMWSYYPSRGKGADNNKRAAYRCWKGLIKKGITVDKLLHAVTEYQLYCNNANITGTTYVKMTTTFLGRDKHYETNWGEKAHAAADEATRKNESTMSATGRAYANLRKLREQVNKQSNGTS